MIAVTFPVTNVTISVTFVTLFYFEQPCPKSRIDGMKAIISFKSLSLRVKYRKKWQAKYIY